MYNSPEFSLGEIPIQSSMEAIINKEQVTAAINILNYYLEHKLYLPTSAEEAEHYLNKTELENVGLKDFLKTLKQFKTDEKSLTNIKRGYETILEFLKNQLKYKQESENKAFFKSLESSLSYSSSKPETNAEEEAKRTYQLMSKHQYSFEQMVSDSRQQLTEYKKFRETLHTIDPILFKDIIREIDTIITSMSLILSEEMIETMTEQISSCHPQ